MQQMKSEVVVESLALQVSVEVGAPPRQKEHAFGSMLKREKK